MGVPPEAATRSHILMMPLFNLLFQYIFFIWSKDDMLEKVRKIKDFGISS